MIDKTASERKSCILVAEDSPIQAEILRRFIEQQGLSAVVAVNGKEALVLVEQQLPELIVSDISMPVMDGFELCRAIKESPRWRHIPVILLTSLDEPTDLLKGLTAGADSYVIKPYDEEDLCAKINTFLSQPAAEAPEQEAPPLEFEYEGEIYTMRASQEKILYFLITTYENAILQNRSLLETQVSLRNAKDTLAQNFVEIEESEERYRSTVQLVPDIIYRTDDKGFFIFVNNAVQSLGYAPQELIGQHFSVLMLPADADSVNRDQVLPRYAGQQTGDEGAPPLFDERRTGDRATRGLEVKLLCKEGVSERWGLVVALPKEMVFVEVHSSGLYGTTTVPDMERLFLGTVGAIRDITKRKYAEEALQRAYGELEDKVRERTAELAASNEALMRSEYELSLKNKISEIFLTIPNNEIYAEVLHTVVLEAMESKYGVFGYIDEKRDLVIPSMTRDIWEQCEVAGKDIIFPRDKWGETGWSQSLTDKKTVFSNQPSKVPEGHIPMSRHVFVPIVFQDEAIGHFGVANKESDYQQTDIQQLESIAHHIAPMLSARLLKEREERERKLAEQKLQSVNLELNQSNEHLEKAITELKATQQYMVQSEKLAALGTLAAGVAHEMNNPMMGIMGYIDFAIMDSEDEKIKGYLEKSKRELLRLAAIVKGMLSFSRPSQKELSMVSVTEMLGHAQQLLAADLRHQNVTVSTDIADALPQAWAKADGLEQVFLNLLMNARDALLESEEKQISIKIFNSESTVVVTIADNGPGIPEDILLRIFDPFFTTKPLGKGTGLGLYICKNMISGFGGSLQCRSQKGQGTEFIIELSTSPVSVELEKQGGQDKSLIIL